MSKPSPSDYLPFLEAARGHEANARASGSLVDAELARLMHAEATRLRLGAAAPPERCIECRGTIWPHERLCSKCGRARQGVKLGTRHVINLVRFFEGYDFASAERTLARMSLVRAKRSRSPSPFPRGGAPRLTLEIARSVRARAAQEPLGAIAASLQVSVDQVRRIVRGERWPEPVDKSLQPSAATAKPAS